MASSSLMTFVRRFFHLRHPQGGFKNIRYLLKWLLIGTFIGIVAGLVSIAFLTLIRFTSSNFLVGLVGYRQPQAAGEGAATVQPFWSSKHPWLLPIVTMAGGLIGGAIVSAMAPGTEKQGTDAMIGSFHTGKPPIRARIPLSKLFATAITIGTGGSAGRAGPAAQICADFGSILGRLLRLDQQDRRIVLATSIGSAIGTVSRAPLGGAVMAAEILYKNDLEMEAMVPALIASIVGYSVFGLWGGWEPLFATPPGLVFTSPPQLLYYVLLGVVCGLVGKLYARGFSGISSLFQRIPLPRWIKPGIGGLFVGLICLLMPQEMGTGYGWIQVAMGNGLLFLPLWIILLLPFTKIITTGLSVGSGGSGGIFGPGMVIGGMIGLVVWRLCYHVLPGLPATPAPFVIIGMMALFGSITHAPLAVMLMAAEMTNNLSVLAPAMIAVSIATVLVGDTTIFVSQLPTRADSPAHRLQFSFPLLSTLAVRQAMSPVKLSFTPEQTLIEAEMLLREKTESGAPVIGQDGQLQGVLMREDIHLLSQEERTTLQVKDAVSPAVLTISPDDKLDEALEKLSSKRIDWAPVVEVEDSANMNSAIGVLSVSDIIRTYREMLTKSPHHIRSVVDGTIMLETTMEPSMQLVGRPLRETRLPEETLVVSIRRQGRLIFPRGGSIIESGDIVTFMVSSIGEEYLQKYLTSAKIDNLVEDEERASQSSSWVSSLFASPFFSKRIIKKPLGETEPLIHLLPDEIR